MNCGFDSRYARTREEAQRLGELCQELGRMLGEMVSKADQFCRPDDDRLQETPPGSDEPTTCFPKDWFAPPLTH